jgi:glyoxalase family protein
VSREIVGIHHITAIAEDPQQNIDFYTGVLGLRLVKVTVNFDDLASGIRPNLFCFGQASSI